MPYGPGAATGNNMYASLIALIAIREGFLDGAPIVKSSGKGRPCQTLKIMLTFFCSPVQIVKDLSYLPVRVPRKIWRWRKPSGSLRTVSVDGQGILQALRP